MLNVKDASTKRVEFLSPFCPVFFTTRNAEDRSAEYPWSTYNPLILSVKSSSQVCCYCNGHF